MKRDVEASEKPSPENAVMSAIQARTAAQASAALTVLTCLCGGPPSFAFGSLRGGSAACLCGGPPSFAFGSLRGGSAALRRQ